MRGKPHVATSPHGWGMLQPAIRAKLGRGHPVTAASICREVAQAILPAVSRLVSTPVRASQGKRRQECRRGTQECVRHAGIRGEA
jgi:hypothetical protein